MKQQESFYRQGINPGKTHEIHLPFSCKRWTSTKIIRLKLSGNFNFTQACRYDIKLNEPSKRKVGLPCSEETFKGYEDIMIFCAFIFIFCLEPTVKKQPMTTTSVTIMVIFFEKTILELLDHSYVESSFANIRRHFKQRHLKWHFPVEDFTGMDQHRN